MGIDFSDKDLLQLIRTGDNYCFRYLYEKHVDLLYNFGFQIARDKEMVKDSIQDVYLDLWHRRKRLPQIRSFKAYLLKSVRFRILRKIRNSVTFDKKVGMMNPFEIELSAENEMINDEAASQSVKYIRYNVNLLPDKQREVVFHLFYHDLNFDEIASVMDLSKKTVYNLFHYALKSLRANVKKDQIVF